MVDRVEDSPMMDESGPGHHHMIHVDHLQVPGEESKYGVGVDDVEDDERIGPKFILVDTATSQQFEAIAYAPHIESAISGVKDVFKPIKNDRELDAEIGRICQTLADDKTADWK